MSADLERAAAARREVVGELLELAARQRDREVLRARGVSGDERQVDLGLLTLRELDLRLLGSLGQTLERLAVAAEVDALVALELVGEPVHDAAVVVVAAEVGVTVGGLHLEDTFADLENRDVERAAAEVEDEDLLVLLLLESVRERGRGGLVDDAQDVEPGDLAGVLGRLPLSVVEVRGNGDHRVGDLLAEVRLGVGLELLQDHRGDLLGRVVLAVDLHLGAAVLAGDDLVRDLLRLGAHLAEQPAHEALDGVDGVLGVDCGLTPGQLSDQALTGARERDHRRGGAAALGVGDDDGLAALHHCDHAVGGAEVDADGLCHVGVLRD